MINWELKLLLLPLLLLLLVHQFDSTRLYEGERRRGTHRTTVEHNPPGTTHFAGCSCLLGIRIKRNKRFNNRRGHQNGKSLLGKEVSSRGVVGFVDWIKGRVGGRGGLEGRRA